MPLLLNFLEQNDHERLINIDVVVTDKNSELYNPTPGGPAKRLGYRYGSPIVKGRSGLQ
jgi:hypothetical protein